MSKSIRFSTLLKNHGPVKRALDISEAEWMAARERGCYATVYHGEKDWATPVMAVVRHDGCVNTLCKIVWHKPLHKSVTDIIGMQNNQEAFDLCNK